MTMPGGEQPRAIADRNRREFFKLTGAAAGVWALSRMPIMAGPFTDADFDKLVPADKKLQPDWVKSLFARGEPTVYRGAALELIGMPVGGICAGQLYLGGDGRLWLWDIFNRFAATGDGHYARPPKPSSPVAQGFALRLDGNTRPLDRSGFADVSFRGEYPIGTIEYRDPAVPLAVTLEVFSPFTPLDLDDSSLPATVLQFTLRNTSAAPVEATLIGSLENGVCLYNRWASARRCNRLVRGQEFSFLECVAEPVTEPPAAEVVFEDWGRESYEGWTVEGTAFGSGPIRVADLPGYQDAAKDYPGARIVNSHATAPGQGIAEKDHATGKLVSRSFVIGKAFINFWIGGGAHKDQTCLNLVVNEKVVRTATGARDNRLGLQTFDVRDLKGTTARIEIVDSAMGEWGNIGIGSITFSERPAHAGTLTELHDFGSMGLALLGALAEHFSGEARVPLNEKLVSELGRTLRLAAGESAKVTFVLAWHFPNLSIGALGKVGRHYATRFDSALAVARHVIGRFERLDRNTRLWRDTWYDSTLPWWFLDRTFLNASILATSTSHRFANGRFWGWEGVGCCHGTCTHVWGYAQAAARLFPELERVLREQVDYGVAFREPTGVIGFRGELGNNESSDGLAVDGQSMVVLRTLREHQMSPNNEFLRRVWPRTRKAMQALIARDVDADGLLDGAQHNTLDSAWFGHVAWLSGLYLAALRASEEMARELGDTAFAAQCQELFEKGRKRIVDELFDQEYFINKVDGAHLNAINSGTGCEIDQVLGQSWAFQAGLGRVLSEKETHSALRSLWRYNFAPDVGPYRAVNRTGRWYALAGEAGLLMCTFPRADWDFKKASGDNTKSGFAGYFNECMNGFEYQVAGHMLWEGLVLEGLAIARAVHDRYDARRRNPWNEVECGDHYARSMASYGVFLAACGFEHHGPKGHLAFAPKLTPENFKAPFTTTEGWGTFRQQTAEGRQTAEVALRWGKLRLSTLTLTLSDTVHAASVRGVLDARSVDFTHSLAGRKLTLTFTKEISLSAGQTLATFIT